MAEVSEIHLSKQSNIQINACRMYQVATLSDISNPYGRTINSHFLEGTKPLSPSSTFSWPKQPFPSPKALNLWRRIVRKHLTQWTVLYSLRQMQHRWNFSIEKEEVYEIHNNKINRYFTVQKKVLTFTLNLDSKEICSTLPQDFIPISFMRGNYLFLHKEFAHSTPYPITLNSFQQHIKTLPNWKKSLVKNYNEDKVNSSLAATIQLKQKLIIESDGSKSKKVSGGA